MTSLAILLAIGAQAANVRRTVTLERAVVPT